MWPRAPSSSDCFFFQAEDGIRDYKVTGVQTCALPILAKLKEPVVYAPGLFAGVSAGGIAMMPKETDAGFDSKGDMIGTAAYMLSKYEQIGRASCRERV